MLGIRRFSFAAFLTAVLLALPVAQAKAHDDGVSVSSRKEGDVQYVVGRIRIRHKPEQVWPIMANPYEFEQKISPKFKTEKVITDKIDTSLITCRVDVGFLLPPIHYTAESHYEAPRLISFRSRAGDLKDFRGKWEVEPKNGGTECDVIYSMYCRPGIPLPQWLMRQAIKFELPHTLTALRDRVDHIYAHKDAPASRKIAAVGNVPL